MTTITQDHERPALPRASAYSRHADYILARQESERKWRLARKQDRRRRALLVAVMIFTVAALVYLSL